MSRLYPLSLSFLVFLVIAACGGMLLLEKIKNKNNSAIIHSLVTLGDNLDRIISHAALAGESAVTLPGNGCSNATQMAMRKIVASTPDIRTLNLARDNRVHCSSVFGKNRFAIALPQTAAGALFLRPHISDDTTRSLLMYRAEQHGKSVLIGIDDYALQQALGEVKLAAEVNMIVGTLAVNARGEILHAWRDEQRIAVASPQFGYRLSAIPAVTLSWHSLTPQEHLAAACILLLAAGLAMVSYRYLQRRTTLLFMLGQALDKQQLTPFIQPIVEARSGKVVAGEVLLRWVHPRLGPIAPDRFIPLAEQHGLITRITTFCLQSVASIAAASGLNEQGDTMLFFNVSADDFKSQQILESCQRFLQQTEKTRLRIGLEMTERDSVEDTAAVNALCARLDALGIPLSIDDFGTGNANYHHLMRFRPRYIKIDKLFTADIENDTAKAAIVRNIIAIAREMQCMTIAEGVETASQMETLAALGVSHFQGYFFARPVDAAAFFRDRCGGFGHRLEI
ncbi:EAL domain-containing protein [Klebsiella sp. R445]